MDERVGTFLDDFAAVVEFAGCRQRADARGTELLETLTGHLGAAADTLPVLSDDFPAHRFADVDVAVAAIAEADAGHRLIGVGGGDQRHHLSFSDLLQQTRLFPQFPLAQPDYANLAVGPSTQRQVVAFGVHLVEFDGERLAVAQRGPSPRYGRPTASLEVLGRNPEAAAALLADVGRRLRTDSVIKGQVVSLTMDEYGASGSGVTFHERPALAPSDVILPAGLLDKVSAHAIRTPEQRSLLHRLGQHLKRGILLYGPPGTGKTHTVRYLLGQTPGTTAILLSGNSLAYVSEAAVMARALQPSLVVLEDCDLIAGQRDLGAGPQPLLFAVLEAMDGLDDDADVAFVLTTNRSDMLERALAQRPGRVDLAVEIPLPAEAERKALLALYGQRLHLPDSALERSAARTAGTTASFARELMRRTVILSAAQGGEPDESHLEAAVAEMMADGQALTRSLLGSNPALQDTPEGQSGEDDGLGESQAGYFSYGPPFPPQVS